MNVSDTVDYEIHRVEDSVLKDSSDCIAIEEPLEIAVRYFKNGEWIVEPLMVTMRTPGDDESLVSGLLFSEGIIVRSKGCWNASTKMALVVNP